MLFVHWPQGQAYTQTQAYRTSELNAITPLDVLRWMNIKTFGIPNPPLDANPVLPRSRLLNFYKKSISFYIMLPTLLIACSTTCNEENPTRSNEINDLIKRVKRKEVNLQARRVPPMLSCNYWSRVCLLLNVLQAKTPKLLLLLTRLFCDLDCLLY